MAAPGLGHAGMGLGTPVVAVGVRCPLEVVVAGGEMVQWGGVRRVLLPISQGELELT